MALLDKVKYRSIWSYIPPKYLYGSGAHTTEYENVVKLKGDKPWDDVVLTSEYVVRIAANEGVFSGLAGPDSVLVPVPSSSLQKKETLWVPKNIADAMAAMGLGRVEPCLQRKRHLRKAAGSANRPSATEQYESMGVSCIVSPKEIVLVDDVVTRGATVLGAATRLREAFPESRISAFIAVRALFPRNFVSMVEPHYGVIRRRGNDDAQKY
ncbi:MAG: hypothetical protein MPJ05_02105 [Nitrosopumilus sp.]|nr:hypothetical protein [Nitrosopumilus sp.]